MTDVTVIPAQFTLNGAKPKLVAVGYDADKAAVWTSDDGYVWQRIHEQDSEFSSLPVQRMNAVKSSDGLLVAVGEGILEYCDEKRDPLFWYSTDLGESWVRAPLDPDAMCIPGYGAAHDVDIVKINGVLRAVAVGTNVWYSDVQEDKFIDWIRSHPDTGEFTAKFSVLAGTDGHLVATGQNGYSYSDNGGIGWQRSNQNTTYYFAGGYDLAQYPELWVEHGASKVYGTAAGFRYFYWPDHSKDREFGSELFLRVVPPVNYCGLFPCDYQPPTPTFMPSYCHERFNGKALAIVIMEPTRSIENIYMLGVNGSDAWAARFSALQGPGCQLENFNSIAFVDYGDQSINAAVLYEPTTIIAVGSDRWPGKSQAAAVWRFGPQIEHPVVPEISPESIQSICQPIKEYIDRAIELVAQNQQILESGDNNALATLEASLDGTLADTVLQISAVPLDIETREAVDALIAGFVGSDSGTNTTEDAMEVLLDVCLQQ